jgi:hypothetical protein
LAHGADEHHQRVSLLERKGIPVQCAYGTDYRSAWCSPRQEGQGISGSGSCKEIGLYVARNGRLLKTWPQRAQAADDLAGFFDLVIGVNTFQYCHRPVNNEVRQSIALLPPECTSTSTRTTDFRPLKSLKRDNRGSCRKLSLRLKNTLLVQGCGFGSERKLRWIPAFSQSCLTISYGNV